MLRLSPDFQDCEIVADGFRNAYAFDFNSAGDLFTFDSDNERCVSLPWYEPTRCYHVVAGGHYGWQNPQHAVTWRMPPYFLDVVAPVATLGRGSPTGVVCYRHTQFPPKYRDGLFLCDWTFGRVYFLPLEPRGSSYVARPEVFLQSVGDNGFAPTAAAVHPATGDLYVSIGGRGTRGAVYRIRYPKGLPGLKAADAARFQPMPRSLEWHPDAQGAWLQQATGPDLRQRRCALDLIHRHQSRFTSEQIRQAIRANWGQADCGLRQATATLLAALDAKEQPRSGRPKGDPFAEITHGLSRPSFDALALLTDRSLAPEARLEAVRVAQLTLGGLMARKAKGTVWEGYSRRCDDIAMSAEGRTILRAAFPSGHVDLDRELSRTLALIEDDDAATLNKIAGRLTADSDPIEDIHYLIVLAQLRARARSDHSDDGNRTPGPRCQAQPTSSEPRHELAVAHRRAARRVGPQGCRPQRDAACPRRFRPARSRPVYALLRLRSPPRRRDPAKQERKRRRFRLERRTRCLAGQSAAGADRAGAAAVVG